MERGKVEVEAEAKMISLNLREAEPEGLLCL